MLLCNSFHYLEDSENTERKIRMDNISICIECLQYSNLCEQCIVLRHNFSLSFKEFVLAEYLAFT